MRDIYKARQERAKSLVNMILKSIVEQFIKEAGSDLSVNSLLITKAAMRESTADLKSNIHEFSDSTFLNCFKKAVTEMGFKFSRVGENFRIKIIPEELNEE